MKKNKLLLLAILILLFSFQIFGQMWSPTKRLTWGGYSYTPAIASDSNDHLHVVWYDKTPGNFEIFYKKSTDGGVNWSKRRLTWNSSYSYSPAIAVDSNDHLHVVWEDFVLGNREIFYKQSTDGGASWSAPSRLTWTSGNSCQPAITVDSDNYLHVVWLDDTLGNLEVFYKKSTDEGASWNIKRLTWTSSDSYYPSIVLDSNNHLHVVWEDFAPGNAEIFYKQSTDGGENWSALKRLTWNESDSQTPAIAIDSNNHIHVVWQDQALGNAEIFYKQSIDGGVNWSALKRLTWNNGSSSEPAITSDSDNYLHVVWRDTTPGNFEIFYKMSTNGGVNWSIERITWNSGISRTPAITVDSANGIHVIWDDDSPGDSEIFYKNRK